MAHLNINDGGIDRRFDLLDAVVTVGRAPENKIIITDKECSRRHCQYERTDAGFKLVDLESRNGTRVNGKFVNQHLLRPGDRVEIGKAVMAYVDPEFKGPPPGPEEAPAAAAAPVTEITAAPRREPRVESDPGAGDKRTGTSPADTASVRRRRGGTSTIERISRGRRSGEYEIMRERRLLRNFAVFAVLFFLLIFGLIAIGSMTGRPGDQMTQEMRLQQAEKEWPKDPRRWLAELETVTQDHRELYDRAQALIGKIKEHLAAETETARGDEQRMFLRLDDFREKYPAKYDELIQLCEEFQTKHPASQYSARAAEYVEDARKGKLHARNNELFEMDRSVDSALKRHQYRDAMRDVQRVLLRYKDDADVINRILDKQKAVQEAARAYFAQKDAEAEALQKQNRVDAAKAIYRDLYDVFGEEKIDELKNLCQRARAKLQQLGE